MPKPTPAKVGRVKKLAAGPADHAAFRTIFENAGVGIFQTTCEGSCLQANARLAAMFGYASPAEFIAGLGDIGRDLYVDTADRERLQRTLTRYGSVTGALVRYKRRDGTAFWGRQSAAAVHDRKGALCYVGTVEDVSEIIESREVLRDAQVQLRASEQRLRDYVETASDWYWESDAENRFTVIAVSGRSPDFDQSRVIRSHRWDLADDVAEEPEKWRLHRAALERREPFRNFTYRLRADDGSHEFVATNGKPVCDDRGAFIGYRGSGRRITEEVRQERRARESEERFRDFADTASDWYWETDREHRISYVSDSAATIGGQAAAAVGRFRWDMAADREGEPEKWRDYRERLDRHEPFRNFRYLLRTSSGALHHLAVSGKPVFGGSGEFLGYRGSTRLITEEVHQAERLREAMRQAEMASAAKSAFLANMSHELRTPLNAIIGFSEIMDRQLFGRIGSARYADYVRDIGASAQHLLNLIEDILDLSKAEAGKIELDEGEIDLGSAIRSACLMLRERSRRGGVVLAEQAGPELPLLRGDRRRVRQILLNLVSNAIKSTPVGGTVTVEARLSSEGELRLGVSDTGVGIAEDDVAKIFEPFMQLGGLKGARGEGTGLGLPLCKELVERHGGRLEIASEIGKGTTVEAIFPARRSVARREAVLIEA